MRIILQKVSRARVEVVDDVGASDTDGDKAAVPGVGDHHRAGNGFTPPSIAHGYVLLVGVADDDGDREIRWMAHKILHLRLFADTPSPTARISVRPAPAAPTPASTATPQIMQHHESDSLTPTSDEAADRSRGGSGSRQSRMQYSILDSHGSILSIPQFTLFADISKGNRPSFFAAGEPVHAERVWHAFNRMLRSSGIEVREGRFGSHMEVSLHNDGPVTLQIDTADFI
jgi:D-tyrosyl-tRNA(Tyr) deacylase